MPSGAQTDQSPAIVDGFAEIVESDGCFVFGWDAVGDGAGGEGAVSGTFEYSGLGGRGRGLTVGLAVVSTVLSC